MALQHITDHVERAQSRLITLYRESPGMLGLVACGTTEAQALEDQLWAIFIETIDTAAADPLDVYGRIVGQAREGRDDATYRTWIKTRVKINHSSGGAEEILAVFTALLAGASSLVIQEQFPAAIVVQIVSYQSTLDVSEAARILQECRAAGIYAVLESPTTSDAESFAFDSAGAGFGDCNYPTVGGGFATALI